MFTALTGRAGADVSGTAGGDLRAQLLAAYGPSTRDPSRPDTAAAAKALGVTQRTIQRYLTTGGERIRRPRPQIQHAITTAARQAATTKRGRAAAVKAARGAATRTGMTINIRGVQGPEPGAGYVRRRTTTMHLDPQHTAGFYDAYITGGENQAFAYLADNSDHAYQIESWYFGDIDDMGSGPPYGTTE